MNSVTVDLAKIDLKATETQTRVESNRECIEQYAEAYREDVDMPPVDLFTTDGETYYVGDGWHRIRGTEKADLATISAVVHDGDLKAATVFACRANRTNGLRRTNADKRRCCEVMLRLNPKSADNNIADHVGVSHSTVAAVRKDLEATCQIGKSDTRVGADGRETKATRSGKATQQSKGSAPIESKSVAESTSESSASDAPAVPFIEEIAAPYKRAVTSINAILRDFKEIADDGKVGVHIASGWPRIHKQLLAAKGAFSEGMPTIECDQCDGKGCKRCANSGFLTKHQSELAERRKVAAA